VCACNHLLPGSVNADVMISEKKHKWVNLQKCVNEIISLSLEIERLSKQLTSYTKSSIDYLVRSLLTITNDKFINWNFKLHFPNKI